MKAKTIWYVYAAILLGSCGQPETNDEFGRLTWYASIDRQGMSDLASEVERLNLPYRQDQMGELTRIRWRQQDDEIVLAIICDVVPQLPPTDRSVSMISNELV